MRNEHCNKRQDESRNPNRITDRLQRPDGAVVETSLYAFFIPAVLRDIGSVGGVPVRPGTCLAGFHLNSSFLYVSLPPMTVSRTLVLKISAGAEVRMSFDKTTKSANLPGVNVPLPSSSKLA